jgi:hypothetical protein
MNSKIAYDVYRGTNDRTLRLATMPGAGLPTHVKRKDWVLIPAGKSPLHSDVDRDVSVRGYWFTTGFLLLSPVPGRLIGTELLGQVTPARA